MINYIINSGFGYEEDSTENSNSEIYRNGPPFYTVEIY